MSLIEAIVAIGLLSMIMAGMITSLDYQQRETALLADKLASLDLKRHLAGILSTNATCQFMLTNAGVGTFDPANINAVAIPPFAQIPSRGIAGASAALVGDGITRASEMSPRLFANSIRMTGLACANPPCTQDSNQFSGTLEIQFDTARTAGPVPPLRIPIDLASTGATGTHTFSDCTVRTIASGGITGGGPVTGIVDRQVITGSAQTCGGPRTNCPTNSVTVRATCPTGYDVSGCGYILTLWTEPPIDSDGDAYLGGYFHANTPSTMQAVGNECHINAGVAAGCGVCFSAQAICVKVQ